MNGEADITFTRDADGEVMICDRCGQEMRYKTPIDIRALLNLVQAFENEHVDCPGEIPCSMDHHLLATIGYDVCPQCGEVTTSEIKPIDLDAGARALVDSQTKMVQESDWLFAVPQSFLDGKG